MNTSARMLRLLSLLQTHRYWPGGELSERLEVSPRTLRRDIDRLREYLKKSVKAEDDLVKVLQSAKSKPSPIDAYFGAVYYVGPIFSAFRGTPEAVAYYQALRSEIAERLAAELEKAPGVRKVEVAGGGYLNLFLARGQLTRSFVARRAARLRSSPSATSSR